MPITRTQLMNIFLNLFNGVSVQSTDDPQSVSSTTPYQYVSVRRKPRGINTEWGDFSHPRLYNNYTKPAIDKATLQELKDTATNAAHESIEMQFQISTLPNRILQECNRPLGIKMEHIKDSMTMMKLIIH